MKTRYLIAAAAALSLSATAFAADSGDACSEEQLRLVPRPDKKSVARR